jgi:hypothetical protein
LAFYALKYSPADCSEISVKDVDEYIILFWKFQVPPSLMQGCSSVGILICFEYRKKKLKKPLDLESTPGLIIVKAIQFDSTGGDHLETSLEEIENWIRSL